MRSIRINAEREREHRHVYLKPLKQSKFDKKKSHLNMTI